MVIFYGYLLLKSHQVKWGSDLGDAWAPLKLKDREFSTNHG